MAKATKKRVGTRTRPRVELFSTRHSNSEPLRLTTELLAAALAPARSIALASAFYDPAWLRKLLKQLPKTVREVRLLFNGLGGRRLDAQREELMKLERDLSTGKTRAQIRLAFVAGIFHTKLFLVSNSSGTEVFVGSANATNAAMALNEEVLARLDDDGDFSAYFERAWGEAAPLDQLAHRLKANSLIRFFRSGSLYFKPTASLQLTLNPFTELFAALPEQERQKLTDFRSDFADAEPGIGPFNLSKAARVRDPEADAKTEKVSVSIKPHAVETYFGYWVPQAEETQLQKKIDEAAVLKRNRWTEVLASLRRMGADGMKQAYVQYLNDVRRYLEEHRVPYKRFTAEGRDPFGVERGVAFFGRAVEALGNDSFMDRLCKPFVSGAMPEIWDDQASYAEFRATFFEYLEYVNAREGRKSRIPSTILTRVGAPAGSSATEIEGLLERHLKSKGWSPSDW